MQKLLAGYQRFRANAWPDRRKAFASMADSQKPYALVVACIDSRVDPAAIFDTGPGDMLTVRNVANLVPPYAPDAAYHGTSAALEFGVRVLEVRHVIVLGHGNCGGAQALLQGIPEKAREFTGPWMSMALDAVNAAKRFITPEEQQLCCEREVVKLSIRNLRGFPWIAERVAAGQLELHGAWFDVKRGILQLLDPAGNFRLADEWPFR